MLWIRITIRIPCADEDPRDLLSCGTGSTSLLYYKPFKFDNLKFWVKIPDIWYYAG